MFRKLINNRYFRVFIFAALVGVLYYDIQYLMEGTGGSSSPAAPAEAQQERLPDAVRQAEEPVQTMSGEPLSESELRQIALLDWGRNPFFTLAELEYEEPVETATEISPPAPQPIELDLQMVLISPRGKFAIINNQTYTEGQSVHGLEIVEIREEQVVLATPEGNRVLRTGRKSPIKIERTVPPAR